VIRFPDIADSDLGNARRMTLEPRIVRPAGHREDFVAPPGDGIDQFDPERSGCSRYEHPGHQAQLNPALASGVFDRAGFTKAL
jgi:hypothetical protein